MTAWGLSQGESQMGTAVAPGGNAFNNVDSVGESAGQEQMQEIPSDFGAGFFR